MANPNIVNVQTIRGMTTVRKFVKTASIPLITNAASSQQVIKVNSIYASQNNRNATGITNVSLTLTTSGGTRPLVSNISIPMGATFVPIDSFSSIYVGEGESLNVFASSNDRIMIICSYEQISDTSVSDRNDDITEEMSPITSLYDFTTHTFTSASQSGPTGPTLAQLQTAYSANTWAQSTSYLNVTTQGMQNWTVPQTGVYEIELGGAGGSTGNAAGGEGGIIRGRITLTEGSIVYITVGQTSTSATGGWNGGGIGGRGGGGATDIRIGGTALSNRVLVAGGGGGGPTYSGNDRGPGGNGGYPEGTRNIVVTASSYTISTGYGGTQSAGGAGGDGGGGAGSFGVGGNGGSGVGGGGGGGWYGGGGGGYWTPGANTGVAGGGGSSYYDAALFTDLYYQNGGVPVSTNGYAKITLIS